MIASLAAACASAVAQQVDEATVETDQVLDRVHVTGTRLRRVDVEGATPVTIVSRADIERIGLNDVGEVLRQLPAVTGSPLGTNTNNGNTGGLSLTNLRGMGTERTLILINGRRSQTADLSTIPVAAIERIEVLKEGASAIYGADAVAGVVNFITRRDFSGVQVTAQFGQSLELERNPTADELNNNALRGSDGDIGRISLTIGDAGPRGSFILGAERTKQDPVYQGNIPLAQFRKTIGVPFALADDFVRDGFPQCLETGSCNDTGGSPSSLGGLFNVPGVGFMTRDLETRQIRPFNPATDLYNFAPINFIQQPFTRTSAFAQGEFDLFENVNAFIETRWANRRSEAELAPTPLLVGAIDPPFEGVSADNAFNPFGVTVPVVARRVAESRRRFTNDVARIDIAVGLRGDFGVAARTWTWDSSYTWGKTNWPSTDLGQFVSANLTASLGPSFFDEAGNAVCGTPDNPVFEFNNQPCVPLNLFGGFGTITPEMLDFVEHDLNDLFLNTQQGFIASAQGDLFLLPAGPVGLAFGYEWRKEKASNTPDSGKATSTATGNRFDKTEGQFEVNSWFMEANIPILSHAPGAEILELGAGVRFDDYSTIGDNTAMMLSARWKPFADLLIRASYSDVFREPTIADLFRPLSDEFFGEDPCSNDQIVFPDPVNLYAALTPEQQARCHLTGAPVGGFVQTTVGRGRVGGNPDLDPESGETVTIGFAYTPSQVPGLTFTVDYWDIQLQDAIQGVNPGVVMNQCIIRGNLDFCDDILRQGPGDPNPGEVIRVHAPVRNTAKLTAKGFDFEFAYTRSTRFGLWNARSLWTWLDERTVRVIEGDEIFDAAGRTTQLTGVSVGEAVWPKWKGLTTLDWNLGNWGASANWEYLDSVTEFLEVPALGISTRRKVPRVMYFDFTGRYTLPWGTRLSVGLTNAFNTKPPFILTGFNAFTDPNTYRVLGRSYFVNLTHDF